MRPSIADYLFFVYLTSPSTGNTMQRRVTEYLMNNELAGMQETTIVA
jgi:hypothetical protein